MPVLPDAPPGIRLISDDEMARLEREEPVPTVAHCITCGGHGSFQWWDTRERKAVVEWQCNCKAQWMLYVAYRAAGIGIQYQRIEWIDYGGEQGARRTRSASIWATSRGTCATASGSCSTATSARARPCSPAWSCER